MDVLYAVRCRNCKRRTFSQDYTHGPLTCTYCGMVDQVEELPPDEMDALANQLAKTQLETQIPNIYQQMLHQQEEARKRQAADLEDLMVGMRVASYKPPSRR